ncbi:thermonuclease family protein [Caballeronia sp. TF1N1]|uniref:thermonuclease family protein n=1 Tax=Caballeronia sp. TF1N1 TaxID=2878153 RepID=UPI001FD5F516|nr:thermonuclease family protein [Caballeronia sp. TF1N1]
MHGNLFYTRPMKAALTLAVCLTLAVVIPANAATIAGRVVGITDGDTLTLLTSDRHAIKIRLADIDAPERHQPFGSRARQALSDLVYGRNVTVSDEVDDSGPDLKQDPYGRSIGRIRAGDEDVNAEMVREGMAWVYTAYNRDPSLPGIEAEARSAGRGLWADPSPTPPWEWCKERK